MKLIQRRAYGFRNFENHRLRVKALCGRSVKLPDFWRNLPAEIETATREGLDPIRAFAEILARTDAGRALTSLVASAEARLTRVRNRTYEGVWGEFDRKVKRRRAA